MCGVKAKEGEALTNGDGSNHWGNNDGEGHSSSNHQVPFVVGDIFAFVAVVDLREKQNSESDGGSHKSS